MNRTDVKLLLVAVVLYFLVTKLLLTPELVYGSQEVCPPELVFIDENGVLRCG